MVAWSSTNRLAEQRSTPDRSAVFSFKLKISNPERVDVWFREFDDIVFDLRLTERMTESQPTLAMIQSHFVELDDAEQQQLLQNAVAHWYDEEARLYRVLRDGIGITGAFEIIYDAEMRKLCCPEHFRLGKQLLRWIEAKRKPDELYRFWFSVGCRRRGDG